MKIPKILLLALCLMGVRSAAAADRYNETKQLTGNANGKLVVYNCYIHLNAVVYLYKRSSARYLVNDELRYYTMKDGSEIPLNSPDFSPASIVSGTFAKSQQKAEYIVASGFSEREKSLVRGKNLFVNMAVTSDGKVAEVRFQFFKNSPYQQIQVSTFARIEERLKQQVYYHKTTLGKNMNYDIIHWVYDFSYPIADPSPTPAPSGE